MELIELKDYQIKAVFDTGGSEKIIAALEEAERNFVYPDASTAKGRKEIISFAAKFSRAKKLLDNAGKELSAYYMAKINPINAERKKLRSVCDQLKRKARQPVTDFENAEAKRVLAVADIQARIAGFKNIEFAGEYLPSATIADNIEGLSKIVLSVDELGASVADLTVEVKDALVFLNDAKTNAEKREAEAAELAFLRAAEERRIKEAEQKARVEAEQRALEEEAKQKEEEIKAKAQAEAAEAAALELKAREEAEQRALEAAALEQKAREEAEQRALEAEAEAEAIKADMAKHTAGAKAWWAEEARQKKLEAEADLKNVKAKNNAALEKIVKVSGISIAQAKIIVIAIHDGDIPNVTINY